MVSTAAVGVEFSLNERLLRGRETDAKGFSVMRPPCRP
jgi:hypothetical protein